jgi:hypothetical protein
MTKNEANAYLDRIREGYPVSLVIATQALQRTGDIPRISSSALRSNGNEPQDDRAIEMESKGVKRDFSYSRYLDSQQNQGIKE